jgi:glutamate-ammonia-ligase adenylyltransferase
MRLRPSGKSGPVATSLPAFIAYQASEAWTWEHMALTRARVMSGPEALKNEIEKTIKDVLCKPRKREKTSENVRNMRGKIAQEKGSKDVWELKYVDGGLVDVEFITQYLQLIHAYDHPQVLDQNTVVALQKLRDVGALSAADADIVLPAAHLYHSLTQIMRLCVDGRFDPIMAPEGLKAMLSRAADVRDFSLVEPHLRDTQKTVAACFAKLVQ